MTDQELANVLRSDRATVQLASAVRSNAAVVPGQAVDLSVGSDEAAAVDARRLIYWLQELAVRPLAEAAQPPLAEQRVALAASAVDGELGSRRKVIARIDALLSDARPLAARPQAAEHAFPPMRVCDEAYLFMRRMVKLEEAAVDEAALADAFVKMPVAERAVRIRRARESKPWRRALTGQEV